MTMKLHILGCCGGWPWPGGASSGYLVEKDDTLILMDCGSGVMSRLVGICDPKDLSAVVLSHLHYDHACDLTVMRYYLEKVGVTLPVYVPAEDQSPMRALLAPPAFDVRPYPEKLTIGELEISNLPVRHPVPCRALRITDGEKTLVFTGDTNDCPGLAEFARDADVLLADAAFTEAEWHDQLPHMSAAGAARLARAAGAKKLYLTHLSHSHAPETLQQEAAVIYPGAQAVHHGLVIEL